MIRKLFSIIVLMTLVVSTSAQSNESAHSLRIYSHSGMTKVAMKPGWTISHSRNDATGAAHNDCVALVVSDGDSTVLTRPIADIDSIVMPGRRTVVFHGATVETPALGKAITANSAVGDANHDDSTPPLLRSSFSGNFPGKGSSNVTFYWTENDRIQLETGDFSHAGNLSADKTKASFVFDGADLDADTYGVYYPNKTVHISSIQTQTGADNSDHIGAAGDCGYDDATQNGDGSYSFTLKHKAAYFCFLPHIDYLPSVKVTKIVVHASSAIAGDYQMSASGLYNGANTSQNITLNLIPKISTDFFIGHKTTTEQDSCAAYMVFVPQNTSYAVTYFLTDTLSRLSTTYYQTFSLNAQPNTVYPVTCNIPESVFEYVSLGSDYLWGTHNYEATVPNDDGLACNYADADTILSKDMSWSIPDKAAADELLNKCSWQRGTYNGTDGWFVTGFDNGNNSIQPYRIFLPLTSVWTKRDTTTSDPAKAIAITGDGHSEVDIDNAQMLSVRPIRILDKEYRIPYKGTETVNLRGVRNGYSFKIYDHAGPNADYIAGADGYLLITTSEDHEIHVEGTVNTEGTRDPFEVYDKSNGENNQICYKGGRDLNVNLTTDADALLFHFRTDGSVNYSGIDLKVTIQRKDIKYNVDIVPTDGGTVSASKSLANPKDTVRLHVEPKAGYVLDHYDIHTADTVLTIYDDDPQMFKDNPSATRHYLLSDSVRVRNGNFWHDDAWFVMPFGSVTVTPVCAKNDTTLFVDVPCSGTMTIERKYIQRLIDAGITAFRFYDYAGKDGKYNDNNVDGSLLIEAPEKYNVEAKGTTTTEGDCDPLIIYDGATINDRVLFNQGGNSSFDVTTLYNNMLIRFKTDVSAYGYDGFEGVISFVEDTTICYDVPYQSNDTITAVVLKEKFEQGIKCIRIFDHGGIGGNYNNYCNGSITLILPLGTTADINGTLDSESNCDWLYIYDDGTEQINQSGSQTITYSSTSNIITIKFTSDRSNVSSGFDLRLNIKKKDS